MNRKETKPERFSPTTKRRRDSVLWYKVCARLLEIGICQSKSGFYTSNCKIHLWHQPLLYLFIINCHFSARVNITLPRAKQNFLWCKIMWKFRGIERKQAQQQQMPAPFLLFQLSLARSYKIFGCTPRFVPRRAFKERELDCLITHSADNERSSRKNGRRRFITTSKQCWCFGHTELCVRVRCRVWCLLHY